MPDNADRIGKESLEKRKAAELEKAERVEAWPPPPPDDDSSAETPQEDTGSNDES